MKNILYIPQFSMNDNNKFFLDKDGNFIVLKTIIKIFKHYVMRQDLADSQYNFKILVPHPSQVEQTVFYDELRQLVGNVADTGLTISFMEHDWRLSPISNRYHFDFAKWTYALQRTDIIMNHIPEISRNIRAVLGERRIPLISFHHFTDFFEENKLVTAWKNGDLFSYFWRQLDGTLISDLNVFNCQSSCMGWLNSLAQALSSEAVKAIAPTLEAAFFTYTDFDEYRSLEEEKFHPLTALFPSRITESLYTNWKHVFELFSSRSTMGRVIITNPSYLKGLDVLLRDREISFYNYTEKELVINNQQRVRCMVSPNDKIWVVCEKLERDRYLRLCSKSHIGINLYENERYGGIAIREAVGYGGLFPVVPNIYEFESWYLEIPHDLLFEKVADLTSSVYNKLVDCYGTTLHHRTIEHVRDNEHYLNYTDQLKILANAVFGVKVREESAIISDVAPYEL